MVFAGLFFVGVNIAGYFTTPKLWAESQD